MSFKIISVGWNCAPFIEQTLYSVEDQERDDWEMTIVYDRSNDGGEEIIENWHARHSNFDHYHINPDQRFAVRNQYEGIRSMAPGPDDIIVFLDLDGDRLAHPQVLERLSDFYADDTLVTYGSYQPVPDLGTCQPASPFPAHVVDENSYRAHILNGGRTSFNHLRTMKGKVFNAIPESYFKWPDGRWYNAGTDYTFMMAGLELAGGRYKFIGETMLLYNHANPHADNVEHPEETGACVTSSLQKTPLRPLP